jgi:hypothetical protein
MWVIGNAIKVGNPDQVDYFVQQGVIPKFLTIVDSTTDPRSLELSLDTLRNIMRSGIVPLKRKAPDVPEIDQKPAKILKDSQSLDVANASPLDVPEAQAVHENTEGPLNPYIQLIKSNGGEAILRRAIERNRTDDAIVTVALEILVHIE